MKNRTIRQRILVSFAAILALMIVMVAVAYTYLVHIELETIAVQTDSLPGVYYGTQIMSAWLTSYALTQDYVLQEDRAAKQILESKLQANRTSKENWITKYESTVMTAKERELFDTFKNIQGPYARLQEDVLRVGSDQATNQAAVAIINTQMYPVFEKAQAAIQAVVDYNNTSVVESTRQITISIAAAKTGILASIAVALGLAFLCGWSLLRAITQPLGRLVSVIDVVRQGDFTQRLHLDRRDEFGTLANGFNRMSDELTALVGQVQQSGLQVNTSVLEIAATAKQQQATASEIASTTTEIGATSREIAATSKELVTTMNDVSTGAEHSAALAGRGQDGLTHMEETMHHVMEAAGSINAKLTVLSEKAGNISQVVITITKVADQTNLLSLNAAIEAEKAGEYGRGFAVVATEIRRLADQTAVATYDIEQMVKEIQAAVAAGVMGMDKFSEEVRRGMQEVQQVGGQLSQIIQQVQALAPRFEAVNEGMQAQTTGAEQISEALTQLSEAARQTVESLRQSSLAIDELNQVASGLRNG
ncbi:MAG TPA: methyl-accepting chemotaxis protein, partial [Candidatus Saccharimonadia bacterium]|nr:methyl-accepting chemotaxis protein [Candidatus Saccharimonadia bacterium]